MTKHIDNAEDLIRAMLIAGLGTNATINAILAGADPIVRAQVDPGGLPQERLMHIVQKLNTIHDAQHLLHFMRNAQVAAIATDAERLVLAAIAPLEGVVDAQQRPRGIAGGRPGGGQPKRKLADLLTSLFSRDELRRFVTYEYSNLRDQIDFSGPLAAVSLNVVEALEGRGQVTATLWDALLAERPGRRADIVAARDVWDAR